MRLFFPCVILKLFQGPGNTVRLVVCAVAQVGEQDMANEFLETSLRKPKRGQENNIKTKVDQIVFADMNIIVFSGL
jgi:hypothetical protein